MYVVRMLSSAANNLGVTTPGQVAGAGAGAMMFGALLWIVSPYFGWPSRTLKDERGTVAWKMGHWVLPGIFVVGGLVAEFVALVGAITGTVWHTGQ
jgi:hypothetical protein